MLYNIYVNLFCVSLIKFTKHYLGGNIMNIFEKNPNPTKDQHFMVDKEMIEYICRKANIQKDECIVEIGGGAGALTEVLASYGNQLTVIEYDKYYANFLKKKFEKNDNVTIIQGNALDNDYTEYDRIVANLPYTITEPFLVNLAKTGALYIDNKDKKSSKVKSITLVVSQNSTRKMVSPIQITEGNSKHFNSEFGLISAICQTCLDVDVDITIPSSAFYPEPAVTSFLVNLVPKKKKTTVDRIMSEFLKDKTRKSASIGKIYQTLLAQGKIYKLNKYKGNFQQDITKFTSSSIKNSNIYELSNSQISQLIKDLIRNDAKMKSSTGKYAKDKSLDDYERYLKTGRYDFEEDELEEEKKVTKWNKKSDGIYSYLYDERRYSVLLNRGLEFLENSKFKEKMAGV